MTRSQTPAARDGSLIPTMEQDLTAIIIADDNDNTLDLTAITSFAPCILLVRGSGDFLEGSNAPDQANGLLRDRGQVWSLAVAEATTWHFKRRTGAGTVTLYLKVLGSL